MAWADRKQPAAEVGPRAPLLILCHIVPYDTMLYYSIVYYSRLYCTILYYNNRLYYAVLYFLILYDAI